MARANNDEEDAADEGEEPTPKRRKAYAEIITETFRRHWSRGTSEFVFERDEFVDICAVLGVKRPKNLGDIVYSFRYRRPLPKAILDTQPSDRGWLILGAGDAKYRFRLNKLTHIVPAKGLMVRKIPDATPEIIAKYALNDEQALLAKIRYNRLIDIFLGLTAYSLQNHLRTKITNYGQIEIDELYTGVDATGSQFVIPVQAKRGKDLLGVIQTIQDVVFCQSESKYNQCIARTVSAQLLDTNTISLFETMFDGDEVSIKQERHYRLVPAAEISSAELKTYREI